MKKIKEKVNRFCYRWDGLVTLPVSLILLYNAFEPAIGFVPRVACLIGFYALNSQFTDWLALRLPRSREKALQARHDLLDKMWKDEEVHTEQETKTTTETPTEEI